MNDTPPIDRLYGLQVNLWNIFETWDALRNRMPPGLVPIGGDCFGNHFCIGVSQADTGCSPASCEFPLRRQRRRAQAGQAGTSRERPKSAAAKGNVKAIGAMIRLGKMSLEEMAMGLAHTNRFRGSAAFFALLLAASGASADNAPDALASDAATDRTAPDPACHLATASSAPAARIALAVGQTVGHAVGHAVGQAIVPASKFSRRRQLIARQATSLGGKLNDARPSLSA
jgi:hypothetical protein